MSADEENSLLKKLDVFERVVRIDTKLDTALAKQTDHEGRVRVLEEKVQMAQGGWKMLVGLTLASGAMGGLLMKILSKL